VSAPERRGWRAALAPLSHRNYALVWWAGLISNVGTWMETVAVGDLVALRTDQAGWTALVAAAGFLPMGLLGPIGGALADRLDRRRLLVAMTSVQMLAAAVLALLAAADRVSPGLLAVVVFVAGCVAGLGFPAYSAMLPDLVPPEDLLAGMSLSQAQWNLGRVVGPALAGAAIALGSYATAFAVNAASFAVMLLALRALRLPPTAPPADDDPLWTRIKVGATTAWAVPGVRSAIVFISIVALTASPFIALVPAMARVHFDGDAGLTARLVTAQGIGAVLGALALPVLAERFGRYRMLLVGLGALAVLLVAYGLAPSPLVATIAIVGVGAAYMSVLSGIGTVVQLRAPTALRARVLSFYFLALGVVYPIGATLQGPVADRVGLGVVTASSGVVMLAALLVVRLVRPARFAALDDPPDQPDQPGWGDQPGSVSRPAAR
jgi:MFS family permease